MRIIAGDFKGRKLLSPKGEDIRPTSDKVKEAVFSILFHDIEDAVCVDLFAGTGSLGIEAISRGAKHCYFADNSRDSIATVKQNVKLCKCEDDATIMLSDGRQALGKIREKIDILFLDPPYRYDSYEKIIGYAESLDLFTNNGIIIAEHSAKEMLPDKIGKLEKFKERKYGTTRITIYKIGVDE